MKRFQLSWNLCSCRETCRINGSATGIMPLYCISGQIALVKNPDDWVLSRCTYAAAVSTRWPWQHPAMGSSFSFVNADTAAGAMRSCCRCLCKLCAAEALMFALCPVVPTSRDILAFFRSHRLRWNCTRDKGAGYDRIFDLTSRSEWRHKLHSATAYGTLRPQGWRVHSTHTAAETSYDRARSLAV